MLRRNKISVYFDSRKTTTHTKIVVIDKRFCFIGSHNMTHSALAYNHEFSLLIDNLSLAGPEGGVTISAENLSRIFSIAR